MSEEKILPVIQDIAVKASMMFGTPVGEARGK